MTKKRIDTGTTATSTTATSAEKRPEGLRQIFCYDCVPAVLRLTMFLACLVLSVMVCFYVCARIIPALGGIFLAHAGLAEDAMLVEWVYCYIMPYLCGSVFVIVATCVVLRAIFRGANSVTQKMIRRIRERVML